MHSVCLLRGRTRKASGLRTAPPRRLCPHAPRKASRRTDFGIIKGRVKDQCHWGCTLEVRSLKATLRLKRDSGTTAAAGPPRQPAGLTQIVHRSSSRTCKHGKHASIYSKASAFSGGQDDKKHSLSRIIEPFYQEYYFCKQ